MNCEICFSSFDHSIHKPFMLSCPHTFCLSCVNKLFKCPTCNIYFHVKHPNIALLRLIPESTYDKLKTESQKTLNEITEISLVLKSKQEAKLNEYLNKFILIEIKIKSKANKLINLIKENENSLLNEVAELKKSLKKKLSLSRAELEITRLTASKLAIETNSLSEKQLTKLVENSALCKSKIEELTDEIEEFKDNIEFDVFEINELLKTGLIGQIETNEKVIF
jgi:hypothetical protein